MYRLSDSDSVDSDKGIRYKTDSIRNKSKSSETDSSSSKRNSRYRSEKQRKRSRSRSPRHHDHSKRKKIKKRKRRHSSEDEDRGRCSSKGRDKRNNQRAHEYLGKHTTTKKSSGEDEKKKSSEDYVEVLRKAGSASIFGPALPPRLPETKESSLITTAASPLVTGSILKKDNYKEQYQTVGPALPPHLKKREDDSESTPSKSIKKNDTSEQKNITGTGTMLPPYLFKIDISSPQSPLNESASSDLEQKLPDPDKSKKEAFGPSLTPELKKPVEAEDRTVGPILPPELRQNMSEDSCPTDEPTDKTIGPSLPPHLRQKLAESSATWGSHSEEVVSEDEVYGPVPAGENISGAHIELEERALKLKMDQLDPSENKQPDREEWMLTLPKAKAANFGLGPRQFRTREAPDLSDRSSWTDTPEDKARKKAGKEEPKVDLQREAELKEVQRRDKEQEAVAEKNKKHKESLLKMHQKKLKKEKKSDVGPSERRPFSREIDLQVNRFDEAQKKAVLKKAQLLDNRFSSGEAKYL